MQKFVQLHMLTAYPPSNLNRDDTGRPKTAIIGGRNRLRVSSQSLKRAWRTSDAFRSALDGHVGKRTKHVGPKPDELVRQGVAKKDAEEWSNLVAKVFGGEKTKGATTDQLVHVSPEEQRSVDALVATLVQRRTKPTDEELELLRKGATAVDIAMFGRMLAGNPSFNVDAAVQVAHAFTIHPVTVEEDYFTAVDDVKDDRAEEDMGAGHVGVAEFGAGVFYHYVCVDRELLVRNLGGDAKASELARRALGALVEAMATVGPGGKQNSFASRASASFLLAEKGDRQPRSLAVAFLDELEPPFLAQGIQRLDGLLARLDKVYGGGETRERFDVERGDGTLKNVQAFVTE